MDRSVLIENILQKCIIYYRNEIISSETIIKKYLEFFYNNISEDEKKISFAFQTGSQCFDVASVAALMMSCFTFNISNNDDTLKSLGKDDMVIYKGQRYRWYGIEKLAFSKDLPAIDYAVLQQDGRGKYGDTITRVPYEKNKHLIEPYYGSSVTTGGRGVRNKRTIRNEFLADVLGIKQQDVPVSLDISVIVISEKSKFIDICQNMKIACVGRPRLNINITDIIPVSYFTINGEEMQIGKNQTKEEAVIKVVSRVTAARNLVLDKGINKVVGLLAIGMNNSMVLAPEFNDLIRRKALKFVLVTATYNHATSEFLLDTYEGASVFACTKKYLLTIPPKICEQSAITDRLHKQLRNKVLGEVEPIVIEDLCSWKDYKKFKDLLYVVNSSNWEEETKKAFVLTAWGLFNLITTSVFDDEKIENALRLKIINSSILTPIDRLGELEKLAISSQYMKKECEEVIKFLKKLYVKILYNPRKRDKLVTLLRYNRYKTIAVIVPKSYYGDLLYHYYSSQIDMSNVIITTGNKFNDQIMYDMIIVLGSGLGSKFEPYINFSSPKTYLLMYEFENKLYEFKKRKYQLVENEVNSKMGLSSYTKVDFESNQVDDNVYNSEENEIYNYIEEDDKFNDIINKLNSFDINKFVENNRTNYNNGYTAEVNLIGTFTSGESILFSKYYNAVVYNGSTNKLVEESPKNLSAGDVIVFTKNNNFTQNIVDYIFNKLAEGHKLPKLVEKVYPKSTYWKEVLRDYRNRVGLTYGELAKKFARYDVQIQSGSIRHWIDEESHIVGPRDENVVKVIAEITRDSLLLQNPSEYYDACRIVRKYRREILGLIGQAINDKYSGKKQSNDDIYNVIYSNVENLSETLELEEIHELDSRIYINSSLTNRPIMGMEVL